MNKHNFLNEYIQRKIVVTSLLMDLIDQEDFSDDQKWIMHLRAEEKMTYRQIQVAWAVAHKDTEDEFISPAAIKTCIKRSALALHWQKGQTYGNEPFLSRPDISILKEYISERFLKRIIQAHLRVS